MRTDASNFAVAAVLPQGTMGSDRPIAFGSRTLNDAKVNYSTGEGNVFYSLGYKTLQTILIRSQIHNSHSSPSTDLVNGL